MSANFLYRRKRGEKGAEYWGTDYEATTKWWLMNSVPERAKLWYELQDPEFRSYLDAFAGGMNAHAETHSDAIDPIYGDVSRFILDDVDDPGSGGYGNIGSFHVITWSGPNDKGIRIPIHGETWVAMVEFSTPVKAYGLMSYGNSRQPGTIHYSDQLKMLSENRYRQLWLLRGEVEAHVEKRTVIDRKQWVGGQK